MRLEKAASHLLFRILLYSCDGRHWLILEICKERDLLFTGGAGGKHTWGALGSELYAEVMASSQDDPNYDSDSQVKREDVDRWYKDHFILKG